MGLSYQILAAGLMAFTAQASATSVTSDFTAETDGWTAVTVGDIGGRPDLTNVLQSGVVPQLHAAGGESAGYISIEDPDSGWTYFRAPEKYLGNKSAYLGGTLVFSLTQSLNSGTVISPTPPHVALQSGDTVLVLDLTDVPTTLPDWRSYAAQLASGLWRIGSTSGDVATTEQFEATLASLTNLYVAAEFVTPVVENTGLDSVRLSTLQLPVPLPAPIALFTSSVLGLLWRRRRAE